MRILNKTSIFDRRRFAGCLPAVWIAAIGFAVGCAPVEAPVPAGAPPLRREIPRFPYVPADPGTRNRRCAEVHGGGGFKAGNPDHDPGRPIVGGALDGEEQVALAEDID